MKESVLFSRLIEEYGKIEEESTPTADQSNAPQDIKQAPAEPLKGKVGSPLMQDEERNTGAVTWFTYSRYLTYAGGIIWAPIIILLLTVAQAAQGIHNSGTVYF